ncbi:MAG TPA: hypothetical protein VK525_11360 [Candidatus Saccharimonadales bacterium]|jgi:hypothetical protein|nr:hypothetical protein [Candidatus Saccharimonadales bacterium]
MYWGSGPELGILTTLGYSLFVVGAALIWRTRAVFAVWVQEEFALLRRSLSRHTEVGPFYGLREESRLRTVPVCVVRSLSRIPHTRVSPVAYLLLLGPLLFFLDFFI